MGDIKTKHADLPLKDGEEPPHFMMEKKFMLVDEYFKQGPHKLPLILKKLATENEYQHREKVRMYLMACDDVTFTNISYIIDPENQFQLGFYNLYTEV